MPLIFQASNKQNKPLLFSHLSCRLPPYHPDCLYTGPSVPLPAPALLFLPSWILGHVPAKGALACPEPVGLSQSFHGISVASVTAKSHLPLQAPPSAAPRTSGFLFPGFGGSVWLPLPISSVASCTLPTSSSPGAWSLAPQGLGSAAPPAWRPFSLLFPWPSPTSPSTNLSITSSEAASLGSIQNHG